MKKIFKGEKSVSIFFSSKIRKTLIILTLPSKNVSRLIDYWGNQTHRGKDKLTRFTVT